ncbi:hypothetical protein IFM89_008619 [Coptis chinensis]|uniref:Peptidase A1 domain-containing protein n=1 Tax=Coptis chinensis TaxID=261450 RepID=A0A835LR34_9MAGN|nr:hypothetical protein IFM89_008619 [Coptis chinensis]
MEYVMEYYIGKETQVQTYGIMDTGSSLVWLQCVPCDGCPAQSIPLFDPSKSTSYLSVTCDEEFCKMVDDYKCGAEDLCEYGIRYGDGSSTKGNIGTETLRFRDNGRKVGNFVMDNVIIGCGHHNEDPAAKSGTVPPGTIGLDRSSTSLIHQSTIKQFSYCFGEEDDIHADGYIKFGSAASLSGNSTPILTDVSNTSYFVNLEGISVGSLRLPIPNDTFNYKKELSYARGGSFIDSGTTYTVLNRSALWILTQELNKRLEKTNFKDQEGFLEVCYMGEPNDFTYLSPITFHFTGVDFKLKTWSTWAIKNITTICLAMVSSDYISILGNYQQKNVEVGYDLQNNVIHFDPVLAPAYPNLVLVFWKEPKLIC